jgi:hypothetical protein
MGLSGMTKRLFYRAFKPAFLKAFTEKNIKSAFEKPGIFPYNPKKVLAILTKPEPEPIVLEPQTIKTPMTCRAIRRVERAIKKSPSESKIALLAKAAEALAAQHSIDAHQINGLREAFKLEVKKRRRGKCLNLLGESDSGPQFFSPARIKAARDYQAQKEAAELARKQQIADKKAATQLRREQEIAAKAAKAAERQLRKEQADREKAVKADLQAIKKALREERKELGGTIHRQANQLPNDLSRAPKTPKRALEVDSTTKLSVAVHKRARVVLEAPATVTRTRTITRLQRFRKN